MHPLIPLAVIGLLGIVVAGSSNNASAARQRETARRRALVDGFRSAVLEAASIFRARGPVVVVAPVANAASDGVRVLVNDAWLSALLARHCRSQACSSAVIIGIAAHEMSHHVHGDAQALTTARLRGATAGELSVLSQRMELRADYEAGMVLGFMGIEPYDFERVLADLSDWSDDVGFMGAGNQLIALNTHPPGRERAAAIRRGFRDARARGRFALS